MQNNVQQLKKIYAPIGTLIPVGSNKAPTVKGWQHKDDFNDLSFATNFGLRPHDGLCVIDVDVKDGAQGMASLEQLGLNDVDTLTARSPSGGLHLWVKIPHGAEIKNLVGVYPGIDLRMPHKGQVLVEPSTGYEWLDWDMLEDEMPEIAALPGTVLNEFVNASQKKAEYKRIEQENNGCVAQGGRNDYLTTVGGRIRSAGMDYNQVYNALLIENGKSCNPPLPNEEVNNISKSVCRYDAPDLIAEKRMVEHGAEVVSRFVETYNFKVSKQIEEAKVLAKGTKMDATPPDGIIPKTGLIAEMVQYMTATAIRPQPLIALSAAVSFIGALAGQKYRTETNLRTNVYIVATAMTGFGKDHARKCINQLADEAQLDRYIGGEDLASGQAVISSLQESPSRLFMIDEFGLKLQAMTGTKANAHQKEIITNLLILYSSAGSTYRGKEYADKRINETKVIRNPNACVLGTTTPISFYSSLKSADALTGTIPRFIIVETPETRPKRQRPELDWDLTSIINQIKEIEKPNSGGNLTGNTGGAIDSNEPITVLMRPDVYDKWGELDDSFDELMTDDVRAAIYSRVAENTAKLALIYAISIDPHNPVIDGTCFEWARDFALWAANLVIAKVNDHVSENEHEDYLKRVLRVIKDSGTTGIALKELGLKTQFIKTRERTEILNQLLESERITSGLIPTKTRPKTAYFYNFKQNI